MGRPHNTVESSKLVFKGVPGRVKGLLFAWAEWRSAAGCAKSPGLPSPTMRWDWKNGCLVSGPAAACLEPSTAPKQVRIVEEVNQCMLAMREKDPVYYFCLVRLVEHIAEPWPQGGEWWDLMFKLGMNTPELERSLNAALHSLAARMRKKGIA